MAKAAVYLSSKTEEAKVQWQFYKQVRILNPSKLPEMDHDLARYPLLGLDADDPAVLTDWLQYVRVEGVRCETTADVEKFWAVRSGPVAEVARVLIHLPVTSGEVERSFSLMGSADTKYRKSLPDKARRTAALLMFNGDVEQRFSVV